MKRPFWTYRLLLLAMSPALIGYTLWQSLREAGLRFLLERLGLRAPRGAPWPIWVHAASVGEVNAAVPLIEALRARYPERPFVITTTTPTGAAMARKRLPDVPHRYLPLDFRFSVARFLNALKPRCAIIMETEIWPRLYYGCARRKIPLVIANARLSPRTTEKPRWVRRIYRAALQHVTHILARSEQDRLLYIALGADSAITRTLGNIKFSLPATPTNPLTLPRPYLLAASTHADEELRLARIWRALPFLRSHLLVIAPRHPKRRDEILAALRAEGVNVAVRSLDEPVTPQTEVYLADTFGELQALMAGANAVFMGGSLIRRGGQNMLEAANEARAPIYGPHVYNFLPEHELLQEHDAAFQVANDQALEALLGELLADPARLAAAGERARAAVDAERDTAARYAEAIAQGCIE